MNSYFDHDGMSFRPVERQDLEKIRYLRNDPSTWVYLTDPRPLSEADQEAWIGGIGARTGKFYFVASDEKRPFIGLVRMDEFDPLNRSIRVGADVIPELRNKGYGILIYRAIKKYCFDHLNVHRIWLEVLETNAHAGRLYAKQGFTVEGRFREAVYRDGKFVDYVIMSILEPEYRK